jgi:WD40 repeat protein
VRALALLAVGDRQILVTGGDGGVRRWDVNSGLPIGVPLAEDDAIRSIAVSSVDGHPVLAAGGDGGLHRWRLSTGVALGPVAGAGDRINAVAVTRVGGAAVVLAGTERIGLQCRHVSSGAPATDGWATDRAVRSLAVSDGAEQPVAVAGDDDGVTIFPLRGRGLPQRIDLGFRATAVAAITPTCLLVGSWRGLYSLTVKDRG